MIEKHMIYPENGVFGVKYDHSRKKLIVGGPFIFRKMMRSSMETYFVEHVNAGKIVSGNKMRYEEDCSVEKFDNGMESIRQHGIVTKQVNNFGRLFR